jgi:hypothetical protein
MRRRIRDILACGRSRALLAAARCLARRVCLVEDGRRVADRERLAKDVLGGVTDIPEHAMLTAIRRALSSGEVACVECL